MLAPICAVDFRGDDNFDVTCIKHVDDALLGVVSSISQQRAEAADDCGEQGIGAMQVMQVTGGQVEGDGVAECVAQGVQLGAQSAFGAPDRFCRAVPPFAPALA